ncbi:MAG: hypothetical protein M1526_00750 [Candidatus Thermoplasmatota archaeon]|nr:hypothetical protein [Candidatus Thermoplasmatota archaeon]
MRKVLIAALVVIAILMAVPLSSATTIHATINTKTNEGYVNATSNYVMYYTYPNNSSASQQLNGVVIWLNATSYLNSSGMQSLGEDINNNAQESNHDNHPAMDPNEVNDSSNSTDNTNSTTNSTTNGTSNSTTNTTILPLVHVVNATLNYQLHVFANSTNLTVFRNLTINLKISNITKKVGNNSTIIDMSWRAFGVQGVLSSDFRGNLRVHYPSHNMTMTQTEVNMNMDVNQLGDFGSFGEGDHSNNYLQFGSVFQDGGFGSNVIGFNTINFHVFSVPLNQWARVYDSSTNSTTFFYNATSNYTLNASMSYNGSNYTIKLKTDPSATITTNGNAKPSSANELVVSSAAAPTSAGLNSIDVVVVGIVILVAVGATALMVRNRTTKK